MFAQFVNITLVDFLFLLPELWLLVGILANLCDLALNMNSSELVHQVSIKPRNLAKMIIKNTAFDLQIVLLYISGFLLTTSLISCLLNEEDVEEYNSYDSMNFFAFNHQVSFDLYSMFFKFILFFAVKVILDSSVRYFVSKKRVPIEFPILIQLFLFFLSILISANDLIIAFIAIVGFSLTTYVLILMDFTNHNAREAALKYFYLSALSSGFIGFGVWLTYLIFLSTNFVEITWILQVWDFTGHSGLLAILLYFLLFGLFFKLAAFPGHLWAAEVYEGSPQSVMALFVLPIKFGVLIFVFKLFFFVFKDLYFLWSFIFWFSSICSMIFGALYALVEKRLRKFFAYSSINQMGFLLMGLVGGVVQTIEASIIFLIIYMVTNLILFIILLNTVALNTHRPLLYLSDLNSFAKHNVLYAIPFAILIFSMAGIPPLAGFFGKYFLLLTIFEQKYYSLVIIGLISSLISTFYYLRIIKWLWFEQIPTKTHFSTRLTRPLRRTLTALVLFLVSYIFLINNVLYDFLDIIFLTL